MIVVAALLLCAASVPPAGGRLSALDDLRLRGTSVLLAALTIQILILSVIPGDIPGIHAPGHIASYLLAGAFFVLNRGVPGLWIVGLGGGLNFLAIATNGGVMPAVAHGSAPTAAAGEFINSAPVDGARLAWLGDVFAVPESWPLTNVFSIGDVLIVVGATVVLHTACGSRLARRRRWRTPASASSTSASGSPSTAASSAAATHTITSGR